MTNNIRKLSDYQHTRLRTEMYLGSRAPHTQTVLNVNESGIFEAKELTWVPAVFTAFREIADNSYDELSFLHKDNGRVDITFNKDTFEFSVEDNGRGIPTTWDENEQLHKCTLALSHARAGRNFESRETVAGTNGIGAAAVNFCSEFFNVIIHHNNEKFTQDFKEGNAVFDELIIDKPQIRKISSDKSGTKITWKLSQQVFKTMILPEEFLKSRLYEVAAANPDMKITYNGEVIKVKSVEKELFKGFNPIKLEIDRPDFKSTFYVVPEFSENEMVHSLVNNIPAFNGGIHIDTFKTEFFRGMLNILEKEGKRRKVMPNRSDIVEGLLIYNITKMKAPDFDAQSKTRLINEWVGKEIKDFFKDEEIFKAITKKNKDWIELIFERAFKRTNKKEEDETKKLAKAAKKAKVEKLRDATGTDRSKCVLFISEGDCLDEDTEIATFNNGEIEHVKLNEVSVGDLVITHTNNIKPVTNISKKVAKCHSLSTKYGTVVSTEEHRLFVYNTQTDQFEFCKVKDIDKSIHKLVKNKIVDLNDVHEILEIQPIEHDVYDFKVKHGHSESSSIDTYISFSHKIGVLDLTTMTFLKITASELDKSKHAILMG